MSLRFVMNSQSRRSNKMKEEKLQKPIEERLSLFTSINRMRNISKKFKPIFAKDRQATNDVLKKKYTSEMGAHCTA